MGRARKCGTCGNALPTMTGRGKWLRYCSAECREQRPKPRINKICSVPGCNRFARSQAAEYCEMHYYRLRRNGSLETTIGQGTLTAGGYWTVSRPDHPLTNGQGRAFQHRLVLYDKIGPGTHPCHWCGAPVSWEKEYPKDLDGLVVDHLDDNKLNNNPKNLVPSCFRCNQARGRDKMTMMMRERYGKPLEFQGRVMTPAEWATTLGISRASLLWRLRAGWPLERAMTERRGRTGPRRKTS